MTDKDTVGAPSCFKKFAFASSHYLGHAIQLTINDKELAYQYVHIMDPLVSNLGPGKGIKYWTIYPRIPLVQCLLV
jgi:hypothetical protein